MYWTRLCESVIFCAKNLNIFEKEKRLNEKVRSWNIPYLKANANVSPTMLIVAGTC